jgi:hypothetical protein
LNRRVLTGGTSIYGPQTPSILSKARAELSVSTLAVGFSFTPGLFVTPAFEPANCGVS